MFEGELGLAREFDYEFRSRGPVLKAAIAAPVRQGFEFRPEGDDRPGLGAPEIPELLLQLADIGAGDEPQVGAESGAAVRVAGAGVEVASGAGQLRKVRRTGQAPAVEQFRLAAHGL